MGQGTTIATGTEKETKGGLSGRLQKQLEKLREGGFLEPLESLFQKTETTAEDWAYAIQKKHEETDGRGSLLLVPNITPVQLGKHCPNIRFSVDTEELHDNLRMQLSRRIPLFGVVDWHAGNNFRGRPWQKKTQGISNGVEIIFSQEKLISSTVIITLTALFSYSNGNDSSAQYLACAGSRKGGGQNIPLIEGNQVDGKLVVKCCLEITTPSEEVAFPYCKRLITPKL